VRLFSFTDGAYFAQALSDAKGKGVLDTQRPLVSLEELAAVNETTGETGLHRFVDPLGTVTPTPQPLLVPARPPSAALLLPLLIFLGLWQMAVARQRRRAERSR
jgi:hypothetical protein